MEQRKVIGPNAARISASPKFLNWVNRFSPDLQKSKIHEVWSFFSPKGELVFALFSIAQRFVFFRSDAVAVFLVVENKETGRKYVVLVEQLRVPAGSKLLEIPAGVIEEGRSPLETAVRETKEEVGLEIPPQKLKSLGTYYSSPGALNEKITLFYCEIQLSDSEIDSLRNRLAGLRAEGENIRVRLVSLEGFKKLSIDDAKTVLAYELYRGKEILKSVDQQQSGREQRQ